ncbi:MAG: restriction endonuclease [Sulfurovaceae bacterium]|nr:restriction endonuclease [Sulfurovaceae bacterium]
MARRSGFLSATIKLAKAIDADNRRQQKAVIREHNAQIRYQQKAQIEQEKIQKQIEKEYLIYEKEKAIAYALDKTNESEVIRNSLKSIIINSEQKTIPFNWNKLKNHEIFSEPKPKEPIFLKHPNEVNDNDFKANINLIDKIFKKRIEKKIAEAETKKNLARVNYKNELKRINQTNEQLKDEYEKLIDLWQKHKKEFEQKQEAHNAEIDLYKKSFYENKQEAVELYFNEIVNSINLSEDLLINWILSYESESKILLIDYDLPDKSIIPELKTMKYITTRKEFAETYIKDKEIDQLYDDVMFQLSLRITNDLYFSDINNQLESIVFNGFSTGINKSTGNEETKCIMSLQTTKNEFMQINIKNVDAKACFLKFKGISGAKLAELIPVAPILQLNKEDNRFVGGKSVSGVINGTNLASIHWEDFEHLIRELFEKEFAVNGSEIKITQASRDGGVDAIMFDPDPIRGGKYIIQAKRYTNVVGVSAVRDLYGTLMNEGAVKGILVTTANYGADSYEFAKDKPITLISGNNLLHMLQKHGYEARIDLEEAKKTLMEK